MPDAVIDNPILNSPFDDPTRHWNFDRDGITNEARPAGEDASGAQDGGACRA